MGQNLTKSNNINNLENNSSMVNQGQETDNLRHASTISFNGNGAQKKSRWIIDNEALKTSNPMFGSKKKRPGDLKHVGYSPNPNKSIGVQDSRGLYNDDGYAGYGVMKKSKNHTVNKIKMANASHQVNEDLLSQAPLSINQSFSSPDNPHGFRQR
jgi:hypothetical protein